MTWEIRVARISIDGETTDIDLDKLGLHEAIALQKATGFRPAQLAELLAAGDAIAMASYVWLVLRRMGKDVTWEQVESGEYYVDLGAITVEMDDPAGGEAADPPGAAEGAAMTSG